jgi:hypothetical protein
MPKDWGHTPSLRVRLTAKPQYSMCLQPMPRKSGTSQARQQVMTAYLQARNNGALLLPNLEAIMVTPSPPLTKPAQTGPIRNHVQDHEPLVGQIPFASSSAFFPITTE